MKKTEFNKAMTDCFKETRKLYPPPRSEDGPCRVQFGNKVNVISVKQT